MEKPTWKYWINKGGPMDGRYYHFKSFRVYWAYRCLIAEAIDKIGFTGHDQFGRPIKVFTNYAERYNSKIKNT